MSDNNNEEADFNRPFQSRLEPVEKWPRELRERPLVPVSQREEREWGKKSMKHQTHVGCDRRFILCGYYYCVVGVGIQKNLS